MRRCDLLDKAARAEGIPLALLCSLRMADLIDPEEIGREDPASERDLGIRPYRIVVSLGGGSIS